MSDPTPTPETPILPGTPEPLRQFNVAGEAEFRKYLAEARQNPALAPPWSLLTNAALVELVPGGVTITRPTAGLASKRQAAELLSATLAPLRAAGRNLNQDVGLWAWLTLLFFDDVCPPLSGRRKVLADPHYIPDVANYQRTYRHLLMTPYTILHEMPKFNRIVLDQALNIHGEMVEQWMSKLYLRRVPSVAEAAEYLYYDPKRTALYKRGAMPKKENAKPGDFRNRFPLRVEQLARTFDIYVLDGMGLVKQLGPEFQPWLPKAVADSSLDESSEPDSE